MNDDGAGEGIRTLDPNLGKVAKRRFWLIAVDCLWLQISQYSDIFCKNDQ